MLEGFVDLYSQRSTGKKNMLVNHMAFTTFRKHKYTEGVVKRTVDYIFIAKNEYF